MIMGVEEKRSPLTDLEGFLLGDVAGTVRNVLALLKAVPVVV